MKELPTPESLATLVSNVTQVMLGMSFRLAPAEAGGGLPWQSGAPWRVAVLPIAGKRPLTVAVASDTHGAALLGSAMFRCPPASVDGSMADDSLSELSNIVAGQVKSVLAPDQLLGLPRVLSPKEGFDQQKMTGWRNATLKNNDKQVRVWIAIAEGVL
jgi:hypothetical protein